MKRTIICFIFMMLFVGFVQAQRKKASPTSSGFYLQLDSCIACGSHGNQIVRLSKKNKISAFNGQAECPESCFSKGKYAKATKIVRIKDSGIVSVIVGPFKTLDSTVDVMKRLKPMLQPVFDDAWKNWRNSKLVHDNGNAYNIEPLSIWIVKKN